MDFHQEIRVLNSSVKLITSYVNYSVCNFPDDRSKIVKTVLPKGLNAKKYFYILLLELISGVNKEIIPSKNKGDNLLRLLDKICDSPQLDKKPAQTKKLNEAVSEFQSWLRHEFKYKIYSQYIDEELSIELLRKDALYLIGNRCKHALPRSNGILEKLLKIYKKSGVEISPEKEILMLEDIDNWLIDDFGGYHFTKLCELSANVYNGIVQYVRHVYNRVYVKEGEFRYSYQIPEEINSEDSKLEFYELLNNIRSPFLPTIKTWKHLEKKY